MSQGGHESYKQVSARVRRGEHTGATVEYNAVMGSWDMAMQSCGGDEGLILSHNPW